MAFRGAVYVGRQACNTSSLVVSLPRCLRTTPTTYHHHVSALTTHFRPIPSLHPQNGLTYSVRAINGTKTADPVAVLEKENEEQSPENWKIKMLYDGDCPLCMREVNMLRERNKSHGTIKFVNISSNEYSPEENQGLDYGTVMGRIHAIQSDGTVVTDIEAFRRLYEAVGLGWVYAITKYEPIATIADAVYGVWAKYRLQITGTAFCLIVLEFLIIHKISKLSDLWEQGRPPLEEVLEARRKKAELCNDNKTCRM